MSVKTARRADDRVLTVSGLRISARSEGEGFPLLLINGLGANVEMWRPAADVLARGSRVIMFDAPGCGKSQTSLTPLSVKALAGIAGVVLEEFGHDRADVLGYSMGGLVAQQLARDTPERIRRLALVATACGWGSIPAPFAVISAVATPWRYYSRWLYVQYSRLLGEMDVPGLDVAAHVGARMRNPPSVLGYAYQVSAAASWSSLPWLRRVDAPTVVVTGDADRLVHSANGVQLAGLLPNSRLHVIDGQGHLLLYGETEATSLLADYFSSAAHDDSRAWRSGAEVDDDDVAAALRDVSRLNPLNALSNLTRTFLDRGSSEDDERAGSARGAGDRGDAL